MTHDAELRDRLKSVHTYAATPFTDDLLHLDLDGFAGNLEFLVEHGMPVIAVGGGTGEIETLTVDELESLVATALQVVSNRALVIACLPGNLAEAVDLPVILYDVPGRTGTALSPSTTLRLAQIPNVRGISFACGFRRDADIILLICSQGQTDMPCST